MSDFLDRFAEQWREKTQDNRYTEIQKSQTAPVDPSNPFATFDAYDMKTPLTEVEESIRQDDPTQTGEVPKPREPGAAPSAFEAFQADDIIEEAQKKPEEADLGPFEPGEVSSLASAFEAADGEGFTLGQAFESEGRMTPDEQKEWATETREEAVSLQQAWEKRMDQLREHRQKEYIDKKKEVPLWLDEITKYGEDQIKSARARIDDVDAGRVATKTQTRALIENVASGLMDDVAGTALRGIARAATDVAYLTGYEIDPKDNRLARLGQSLSDYAKENFPGDPRRQHEFTQKLARGVGNLVGFYGVAIIPRLLKLGVAGMVGAVATVGGAVTGQHQLDEAEEYEERDKNLTLSESEKQEIFYKGAGLGLTEAIPFFGLVRRSHNGFADIFQSAIRNSVEEAGQESFQQLGSNLIARGYYDPERDPYSGVLEGAMIGGLLGLGAGGGMGIINQLQARTLSTPGGRPAQQEGTAPDTPESAPQATPEADEAITVEQEPGDITTEDITEAAQDIEQAVEDSTAEQLVEEAAQAAEDGQLEEFAEGLVTDIEQSEAAEPVLETPQDAIEPVSEDGAVTQPETGEARPEPPAAEPEPAPAFPAPESPQRDRRDLGLPPRPITVITAIRSLGGIKPTSEMRAMDAHRVPGLINRNGMSIDNVREALVEQGFLQETGPEGTSTTTPQDVYDLIDRALRGERVVSQEDWADEQVWQNYELARDEKLAWREALDQELDALNQKWPEMGFNEQYQSLNEDERSELLVRFSQGDAADTVLEDIYVRRYNDPDAANAGSRATLAQDVIREGTDAADSRTTNQVRTESGARSAAGNQSRRQAVPAGDSRRVSPVGRDSERAAAAPTDAVSIRKRFVEVLESKTPRKRWAAELGINDVDLEPLLVEQIAQGRLRRTKDGKVWRTPRSSWPRQPEREPIERPEGPDDDMLYSLFGRFWKRRQTPTQEDVIEAWQAKSGETQEWPFGNYNIRRVPDNGMAVTYQVYDGDQMIGYARVAPPSTRLAYSMQEIVRQAELYGGDVTPEQFQRDRLAGEVTMVDIEPAYQRRGIGQRLYQVIDADMKSIGAELFPSRTYMSEAGEALWLRFDPKRLVEFYRADGVDTYDPRMVRAMQAAGMDDTGTLFALPRHVTKSPAFRNWFGESKIVDAEGQPLVVYHGGVSGIEMFSSPAARAADYLTEDARNRLVDVSFFAADSNVAESYSRRIDEQAYRENDPVGAIYPVYLSIQNPLEVDMQGQAYDPNQLEGLIEQARDAGHDGVVVYNVVDDYYQRLAPTTVYATFDPRQIKSAIGNRGSFDPEDPRMLFTFAGERALTADRNMLSEAQARLARGEDPGMVWTQTGWWRGQDGHWRFEIDDSDITFKEGALQPEVVTLRDGRNEMRFSFEGRLGDLINAPSLFAAYPDMADYPTAIDPYPRAGRRGGFNPAIKSIEVTSQNPNAMLDTLVHEIQHGIQTIEEFSNGGNQFTVYARLSMALFEVEYQISQQPQGSESIDPLNNIRTEILRQMEFVGEPAEDRMSPTQFELYERLFGEVEARNVSERRQMREFDRRLAPPPQTEDVDAREQFGRQDLVTALPENFGLFETAIREEWTDAPELAKRVRKDGGVEYYNFVIDITLPNNKFFRLDTKLHPDDLIRIGRMFGLGALRNSIQESLDIETRYYELAREMVEVGGVDQSFAVEMEQTVNALTFTRDMLNDVIAKYPELEAKPNLQVASIDPDSIVEPYDGPQFSQAEVDNLGIDVSEKLVELHKSGVIDEGVLALSAGEIISRGIESFILKRDSEYKPALDALYERHPDLMSLVSHAIAYRNYAAYRSMVFDGLTRSLSAQSEPLFHLPGFYSPSINFIRDHKQQKAPLTQWIGMLKKASGVRQEELDWIGIEQWEEGLNKKTITKDELLGFMRAHQIELDERVLEGTPLSEIEDEIIAEAERRQADLVRDYIDDRMEDLEIDTSYIIDENFIKNTEETEWGYIIYYDGQDVRSEYGFKSNEEAEEAAQSMEEFVREEIKKDIRENIEREAESNFDSESIYEDVKQEYIEGQDIPLYDDSKISGGENYTELLIRLPSLRGEYFSPHFSDYEIVHIRFDKRIVDGKKILFINELQSDLHQRARRRGYKQEGDEARIEELKSQENKLISDIANAENDLIVLQENLIQTFEKFNLPVTRIAQRYGGTTLQDNISVNWVIRYINNKIITQIDPEITYPYDPVVEDDLTKRVDKIINTVSETDAFIEYREHYTKITRLNSELKKISDNLRDLRLRFPQAPYKNDGWVDLALKRILLYATENGYDAISWARADQIAPEVGAEVEDLRTLYNSKIGKFYQKYTKKWDGKIERMDVVESERRTDNFNQSDIAFISRQIMRSGNNLEARNEALRILNEYGADFSALYAAAQNTTGDAGFMLQAALGPYRDRLEGQTYRYDFFNDIRPTIASTARDIIDSVAADVIDIDSPLTHVARRQLADALNAHVNSWEQGQMQLIAPEVLPIPNEQIANDIRRAASQLMERQEKPTNPVLLLNDKIRESVHAGQPLAMRGGRHASPLLNQQNIEGFLDEWRQVVPPKTMIRVQEKLPMDALGAFKPSEDMILISAYASNPQAIFRHEQIHALRNAGLFSAEEWKILTTTANRFADQLQIEETYGAEYRRRFSPERAEEALAEEAVAGMAQMREEGASFGPESDSLLDRILRLMERLKNWVFGRGFKSHVDILQDVASGRIARRAWQETVDKAGFSASTLAGQPQRAAGSPGPPPVIPGISSDAMSLVDIQRELRRRLGLTTRRGRLNRRLIARAAQQGRVVAGQYGRHSEVIRLKVLEDIDTEAHEIGHALEDRLPALQAIQQRHDTELLGIAALNGDNTLTEGFAEFFRLYLTNPQAAEQHAPNFFDEFEIFMDAEAPRTLQDVQDIRDMYREWRNAPSSSRLTAAMKSGIRDSIKEQVQKTYNREGMQGLRRDFWNWLNSIYTSRIDRYNPIRNWVEAVAQIADERGIDLDLTAWRNPHMNAAKMGAHDAAAYMDITKGIHWENVAGKGAVSMREALRMAFNGQNYEDWSQEQRDALGAYLIARRGRWLWQRFEMDPVKFLGRRNSPPMQAAEGEWYYDLEVRKRRVMLNGRWEDELIKAPDKHARGDHEQTIQDLEAANPQFERAAQMLYQFLRDLALLRYQAGLDSWEEYQYKIGTADYVPWFRDMSDQIFAGTALSGRKVAPKFKLRGSYRDFINPIEGIVRQVHSTRHEIAVNKPKLLMAKMVEQVEGAGAYGEIIPAQRMRVEEVRVRDVLERAGREAGMPPEDIKQMISSHIAMMGEDAVAKLFRVEEAPDSGDVILHYMDRGELKMIQIGDGDGKDLARRIFGIFQALGNSPAADGFAHFVASAVRIPQRGITAHPLFLIRNAIRDTYQSAVMQAGYFPVVSNAITVMENARRRLRSQETWADVVARHGGIMGGINRANIRDLRGGRIDELRFDGVTLQPWKLEFWSRTLNPLHEDFWRWAEWSEANARQTLARISFQRSFADIRAHYPNMQRDQQVFIALQQAVQQSRDYVDYGRMGDAPSQIALNRLIMFLNPALQGVDKMIRKAFLAQGVDGRFAAAQVIRKKLKPLFDAEGAPKKLTKREVESLRDAMRVWVTIAGIAAVHLAIETLFNDEEDLEDRPELERALYVIFTVNGTEYRIPRGFDIINVASNGMRAMYEAWFREDPTARQRFVNTLAPALVPPTGSPLLDLYIAGKHKRDNFFDRAIVPEYMKGRLPEERYSAYTSKMSRDIAETINPITESFGVEVSPLIVEHTLNTVGTDWARDILRIYDTFDPDKPEIRWQDAPFIRGLTSSRSTRATQDFWEMVGRDGEFMQAAGSYKEEAVNNNRWRADEIRAFFERRVTDNDARAWAIMYGHMDTDQRRLHPMERAKTFVKSIRGIARDVSANEVVTPDSNEKVNISREVRRQVMEILDEVSRREYRNALIAMNRPGYEGKPIQPVQTYLDELETISPETYKALMHEITFKDGRPKVYDFKFVRDLWPQLRRQILDPSVRERIIEAEGQIELDLFSGEAAAAQLTGLR